MSVPIGKELLYTCGFEGCEDLRKTCFQTSTLTTTACEILMFPCSPGTVPCSFSISEPQPSTQQPSYSLLPSSYQVPQDFSHQHSAVACFDSVQVHLQERGVEVWVQVVRTAGWWKQWTIHLDSFSSPFYRCSILSSFCRIGTPRFWSESWVVSWVVVLDVVVVMMISVLAS